MENEKHEPFKSPDFTGFEKTLSNTTTTQAKDQVTDIETWGDSDMWKLICKAWSKKEGWMKSTKAMEIEGVGVLVQVTTQQRNLDGSYVISEALTTIVRARIDTVRDETGKVIQRKIVAE